MSAVHRWLNLAGVLLPFLGFVVAVVLLWNTLVDWSDLAVMLIMYVISGYGVTLGFHRLLTHRSFQTFKPVEYTLAILGSLAVQGPVISWVADHRKHHAHTDRDGDPHSPHGHGGGLRGAIAGLWYAHMGWLFHASGTSEHARYARDLHEDRGKPPHVPPLRASRPAVVGGRPDRMAHPGTASRAPRVERRRDLPGAPAAEARRVRGSDPLSAGSRTKQALTRSSVL